MTRKTVGIASVIWGVSILLSRLIGLIRESVIGRTLGGGSEADAYWTAFVLPDFLNYLLAGGVLSIVFIPIFGRYLVKGQTTDAWRSFSVIANVLTLAMVTLTAVLWVLVPDITPLIAPGITGDERGLLNELVRIILPAQIFHLVGGLLSATLQAQDKHIFPALAPLVYTGCIILGGLLFGDMIGAKGFAWGVLVGSFLGPFCLPLFGALRAGLNWQLRISLRHQDLKTYVLLSLPVMLGFSIIVLDDMLLKHFGSMISEGVISRLQYAKTLMKVPMGVFGLAVGVASYPTLSRLLADSKINDASSLISDALCGLFVLAFIAQAALTVVGPEMAGVIWGQTRFNAAEIAEIGLLTGILSLGLWAWSAQVLVARGFYALGDTWTPTIVGSVIALGAYPLYQYLGQQYGPQGLAAASACAITIYCATLAILLRRRLKASMDFLTRPLFVLVKMVLATIASVGLLSSLKSHPILTEMSVFWRGLALGLASIGLVILFAALLRVSDVTHLARRVVGRLRRRD